MSEDGVLALLAGDSSGYRGLYYRWEQEQWEAGKVDLTEDRARWPALDAVERRRIVAGLDWRRVRAELAATGLVAFVDSAPSEEQQVFLTTQLADEARTAVFLDRVATEVFAAEEDDMGDRSSGATETMHPDLGDFLADAMPASAEKLRRSKEPVADLIGAVARYHLCVLGAFGLTELDAVLEPALVALKLPGVAHGVALSRRDSIRHVAFGLRFVEETAGVAPGRASLEAALNSAMPRMAAAFAAVGAPGPGRRSAEDLHSRARNDLSAWLRAVQLRVSASA